MRSFINVGYVWQILGMGPERHHPWAAPETPILNKVKDPISIKGGQTLWKLFYDVFKKDSLLEANLRKAQKKRIKYFTQVIASKRFQFPSRFFMNLHQQILLLSLEKNWGRIFKIFNTWWIISNSKFFFNPHFGP